MYQGTASAVPQTQQKEARVLTPAGSLPVELALSIARQIAEGLGAAHAKGMVHRDIKPDNILLKRDAGAWLPKIADFGIVATKESSTAYTRTGGTLLTMAYAAPEQWRGTPAAELDGRTDLYALGGLLYEMLTGRSPFQAENYEGWSRQHQTTPPQPPSALRPDLANWLGLDALTLRLLAKDRNDRPKDVAELIGLIDAVRNVSTEVRRKTVVENPISLTKELIRGNGFRKVPRWFWIISESMAALVIVIAGLVFSLPTTIIAKHADELDKLHHYDLGGLLRNFACTRGEGESCFALARTYYLGRGVATDYSRAASLYSRACDAGNSKGCGWLGAMYEGQGLAKDAARAAAMYSREVALLSKACDAGDPSSCNDIGGRYRYDFWGKKDLVRAAESFSKACDGGSADGCKSLGSMYLEGVGVPKDFYKAVALQTKACNLGDGEGCFSAALEYQYGRNIEKNTGRARELYQKFCAMGEEMACAEAAKLR
jgi:hypothetical protein